MLEPGSIIGPYKLIQHIARGGFGEVWLAEKPGDLLPRQYAIKLPLLSSGRLTPLQKKQLAEEAINLAKVSHGNPNIHPIIEASIYDGQAVIVTEFVPEGSLEDWLRKHNGKATDWQQAVRLVQGILNGLTPLQTHNMVHRDLKPSNILMPQGTPRLTDFGLARILKDSGNTSMPLGTTDYMAPETFQGKRSFQSDIWAVGVILYRLLTGTLPFGGPEKDSHAKMYSICDSPFPPLGKNIPVAVQAVVSKALSKKPSDRYDSAKAMQTALQQALDQATDIAPVVSRRGFLFAAGAGILAAGIGGPLYAHYNQGTTPNQKGGAIQNPPNLSPPPSPTNGNTGVQPPNTKTNPKDGAVMIWIPTGDFLMGDDNQKDNPRHKVTLSGYWIYKDLVTVGMYKKFCQVTSKEMPKTAPSFDLNWSKEDHPMVEVSWDDATAYCTWASEGGVKVTLPTEAQWEKAARGTDGRKYPWGETWDASKCANSVGQSLSGTVAVGQYTDSPYHLSDMAGNVWQWCADYYDAGFWGSSAAQGADPVNQGVGEKKYRILRGGSWFNFVTDNFRASYRFRLLPDLRDGPVSRYGYVGFRCAAGL